MKALLVKNIIFPPSLQGCFKIYISLIFSLFSSSSSSSKTNVGRFKLHEFCFEITDDLALTTFVFLSKALKGTEKQRE